MNDEFLEYLFFTQSIADTFIEVLKGHNLDYSQQTEPVQNAMIS